MTPDEIFNILKECADFELKQTEHGVHTQQEESHKEMLQNFLKK